MRRGRHAYMYVPAIDSVEPALNPNLHRRECLLYFSLKPFISMFISEQFL